MFKYLNMRSRITYIYGTLFGKTKTTLDAWACCTFKFPLKWEFENHYLSYGTVLSQSNREGRATLTANAVELREYLKTTVHYMYTHIPCASYLSPAPHKLTPGARSDFKSQT
jgi:hypothetical protein